jgi:hypothetical protein
VGGFHSIWVGNLWVKYPLDGSTLVIPSRCGLISFFIPVDKGEAPIPNWVIAYYIQIEHNRNKTFMKMHFFILL